MDATSRFWVAVIVIAIAVAALAFISSRLERRQEQERDGGRAGLPEPRPGAGAFPGADGSARKLSGRVDLQEAAFVPGGTDTAGARESPAPVPQARSAGPAGTAGRWDTETGGRTVPDDGPPAGRLQAPGNLPEIVPLGKTAFSSPNNTSVDFLGRDVRSVDQLPWYLLGAVLDPLSFSASGGDSSGKADGEGGLSWSARWKGPGRDDGVSLSWKPGLGWDFSVTWQGSLLVQTFGYEKLSFSGLFSCGVQDFASSVEGQLRRAGLPAMVMATPKEAPASLTLPDGYWATLAIPLRAADVPEAVCLFSTLQSGRLRQRHVVIGCILLCRCLMTKGGFSGREEAMRYARMVEKEDGLPLSGAPTLENGTLNLARNACVLKLSVPYHAVSGMLRHFQPVISNDFPRQAMIFSEVVDIGLGLQAEKLAGSLQVRLAVRQGDCSCRWVAGRRWKAGLEMPAASGAEIESFLAALDRVSAGVGRRPGQAGPGDAARRQEGIRVTPSEEELQAAGGPLDRYTGQGGGLLIFFANSTVAPLGPAYQFLYMHRDDAAAGKASRLHFLSLHPFELKYRAAGSIEFPAGWDGSWEGLDAASLAGCLDRGSELGILAPALWLPESLRRRFLELAYSARGERLPQMLARLELFPDDIFARFDADLAELRPEKYPDMLVPESRLASRGQAIAGIVRLCLDREFQQREQVNVATNWHACLKMFPQDTPKVTFEDFARLHWTVLNPDLYRQE